MQTTDSSRQLRHFIERLERLQQDCDEIKADMREVFAEAKAAGFIPKIMRQVLRLRRMDPAEMSEEEMLLHTYMGAMGMQVTQAKDEARDAGQPDIEDAIDAAGGLSAVVDQAEGARDIQQEVLDVTQGSMTEPAEKPRLTPEHQALVDSMPEPPPWLKEAEDPTPTADTSSGP